MIDRTVQKFRDTLWLCYGNEHIIACDVLESRNIYEMTLGGGHCTSP